MHPAGALDEELLDEGEPAEDSPAEPRAGRKPPRFLRPLIEVTLVFVGVLLTTVAATWPLATHLRDRLPGEGADPLMQAWMLGWDRHALLTNPGGLWDANIFWPAKNTFALSETLLGYVPLTLVGGGMENAVLSYNLLFLLLPAMTAVSAHALVRQLGARASGALFAALACTYAPWRLAQISHLHILSIAGMLLTFAMLARGHGYTFTSGYRRANVQPTWIVLGWLAAGWQLMTSISVGLPFVYVLIVVCLIAAISWLIKRPALPIRLLVANVVGGLAFGAVSAMMVIPYLRVAKMFPRALDKRLSELEIYSAAKSSFLAAPPDSWLWGQATAGFRAKVYDSAEMWLFPGAALVILAVVGLFVSRWSIRVRITAMGAAVVFAVLATGVRFADGAFGYALVAALLPGWNSSRTPGRLIIFVTILLAILAAGAVSRLLDLMVERRAARAERADTAVRMPVPVWRRAVATVAAIVVLAVVFAEGVGPVNLSPVTPAPRAFAAARAPIFVLPPGPMHDPSAMLWSLETFPALRNGYSGYVPREVLVTWQEMLRFPNPRSVRYLRKLGVRSVVVDLRTIGKTKWARTPSRSTVNLGVTVRRYPDSIVYGIN